MTGEWLAWCQACPVPEIANVFHRASIPFFQVTGMLEDDPVAGRRSRTGLTAATSGPCDGAQPPRGHGPLLWRHARCLFGPDPQCATFGGHIEIVEVDELAALRGMTVSARSLAKRVAHFQEVFDVQPDCAHEELERAARTSVALDRLVEEHDLGLAGLLLQGTGNPDNEDAISSIILGN